jgi:hypothetical protein
MNIQIAHRKCVLAPVAALLMVCTVAWAQNPHAGTWETRELTIKDAAAGCRYVEAVTATFQLAAGINNAVAGYLTRRFERSWWLASPGCVLPGVNTNPGFTLRQDNWAVTGEPQGRETQRLKGVYAGCTTDCKEPWNPPGSFEIDLVRRPVGMSGGLLKGLVGTTMFRDSYQSQLEAANASEAFMMLVQPLLDGRCDEFLLRSMDASSKRRFPRDLICAFGTQLTQLLPTVIRHEKSQAHSATLAQVTGMTGPLVLSEGDVLVQRFLVVNSAGNGLFLGAALRKQADGSWRVLDLVQ